MKALILLGLQNDYMAGGPVAVPGAEDVVPVANALMDGYPLVIAMQDWHPSSHQMFVENNEGAQAGATVELGGVPHRLWLRHCVQGSEGAELVPALDASKVRRIFKKGIDPRVGCYSAFRDLARQRPTGLGEYLEDQGVREVHLLGVATEYAVKFTARDAITNDFRVRVIADAIRGLDEAAGAAAVDSMKGLGIIFTKSGEL